MKINTKLIVLIIFPILTIDVVAYGATIVGSRHDISTAGEEICVFCHTPHFSNTGLKPLWNRQTTTSTFTPYSSPTMNTSCPAIPNPSSLVCFSCHDGVNANNKMHDLINGPGAGSIPDTTSNPNCNRCHWSRNDNLRLFGDYPTEPLNLGAHHPISNTYPTTVQDLMFNTPPDAQNGWSDVKLDSGRVECISCHEPHDPSKNPFLRKSNIGSALCFTCHKK
ncbi:MAG: cytochrome c3 family protein [Nitrospirae bacterium]|nr:cytochrome c3 family protein [Nitrospirota bacterium]